jgi:hypothetical protein
MRRQRWRSSPRDGTSLERRDFLGAAIALAGSSVLRFPPAISAPLSRVRQRSAPSRPIPAPASTNATISSRIGRRRSAARTVLAFSTSSADATPTACPPFTTGSAARTGTQTALLGRGRALVRHQPGSIPARRNQYQDAGLRSSGPGLGTTAYGTTLPPIGVPAKVSYPHATLNGSLASMDHPMREIDRPPRRLGYAHVIAYEQMLDGGSTHECRHGHRTSEVTRSPPLRGWTPPRVSVAGAAKVKLPGAPGRQSKRNASMTIAGASRAAPETSCCRHRR